jgi:hypothetical protein
LFKTGETNWIPILYTSTETLTAEAWYPKSANTTIAMTSTELANPSYVLAYMCTWTGSTWKCGCQDDACTQSYWQIQKVQQTTGTGAVNMSREITDDVPLPPPLP